MTKSIIDHDRIAIQKAADLCANIGTIDGDTMTFAINLSKALDQWRTKRTGHTG